MRYAILILILAGMLACSGGDKAPDTSSEAAAVDAFYKMSHDSVLALAREKGLPVLLDFYSDT